MYNEEEYGKEFFQIVPEAMSCEVSEPLGTMSSATSVEQSAAPSPLHAGQTTAPAAPSNLGEDDDLIARSTSGTEEGDGTVVLTDATEDRKGKGRATTVEDVSDDGE